MAFTTMKSHVMRPWNISCGNEKCVKKYERNKLWSWYDNSYMHIAHLLSRINMCLSLTMIGIAQDMEFVQKTETFNITQAKMCKHTN